MTNGKYMAANKRSTPEYKIDMVKDLLKKELPLTYIAHVAHVSYQTVGRVKRNERQGTKINLQTEPYRCPECNFKITTKECLICLNRKLLYAS